MADTQPIALEARALTVRRRGDAGLVTVLDGVSLSVAAGTLVDVIGESGSGKTTLLLALARLIPNTEGRVILFGSDAHMVEVREWRSRVAYLPQRSSIVTGTVRENLTLPWRLSVRADAPAPDDSALRSALDSVRLEDVALDRDASRLSEGQAARVALLRTVLTSPDILLLDEPDASLDDESAAQVGALTGRFVEAGGTVVRVRHLRADATADQRLRMIAGRLEEA